LKAKPSQPLIGLLQSNVRDSSTAAARADTPQVSGRRVGLDAAKILEQSAEQSRSRSSGSAHGKTPAGLKKAAGVSLPSDPGG
jgi:hypothetical protein